MTEKFKPRPGRPWPPEFRREVFAEFDRTGNVYQTAKKFGVNESYLANQLAFAGKYVVGERKNRVKVKSTVPFEAGKYVVGERKNRVKVESTVPFEASRPLQKCIDLEYFNEWIGQAKAGEEIVYAKGFYIEKAGKVREVAMHYAQSRGVVLFQRRVKPFVLEYVARRLGGDRAIRRLEAWARRGT